ncbi:MAG TPA: alpha/beta fold hydrolase [Candidatus Limnocylindrales bacterium]|nr:alpha/beta fold hydrolase [Candidatus Limnocylindrales bacterium]
MIGRFLVLAAAPVVALFAIGPVVDRLARRLMDAPRRLPEESGMQPGLDRLGGEVVRLRSRDGVRLTGRWLEADPEPGPALAAPEPWDAAPAEGDGPWVVHPREAILLLHGWSGSVTPDLLELGPFLRRTAGVLGLDFRGHGGSDDGPTTFGLLEVEDVAGALAWLGERGIRRVAIVGSSMGGITAIAAVAVLGDGRLAAADRDLDAPAAAVEAPRPRICAVVADSVTPELAVAVGSRLRLPFGRRIANHAFGRMARHVGDDPRATQPIDVVGLVEDVPLLLVHGGADGTVPLPDADRLAAAAPDGSTRLVIEDADHGRAHAVDPARYEAAVTSHIRAAFQRARP